MGTDTARPVEVDLDLRSRVRRLLHNDSMSDVVFVVDDPPRRCSCHKLILALGSKVFEAMFFGHMPEEGEVRAPDITKVGFTVMLRYLYTDAVTIGCESDCFEAAYAAKKYLIKPLFRECESYLLSTAVLSPQSVFPLYEKARFLDMKRLQGRCLRFVSRHAKKLLHSRYLSLVSKSTLQDILKLDLLDIDSEVDLIAAVWEWGREQCKSLDVDPSEDNVRKATKDFVQHVRFLSISKSDLKGTLDRFQLLDATEQLAVLWNLAMSTSPSRAKLPANFSNVIQDRSIRNCSKIDLPAEYKFDCGLTSYRAIDCQTTGQISVSGSPIVLVGAVLAYKPIPCYSLDHRTMDLQLEVVNSATSARSRAKCVVKAETSASAEQLEQNLLLDDFVSLSEGESITVTVRVVAEGVRVMQCPKTFSRSCSESEVTFCFEASEADRILLPIKEIMYAPSKEEFD